VTQQNNAMCEASLVQWDCNGVKQKRIEANQHIKSYDPLVMALS